MKKEQHSLLRFAVSSGLCFLLDYGLFTLLNTVLLRGAPDGAREYVATYGARVVSAAVNFLLNRNLVFRDPNNPLRSGVRYAALAVVQAALSAGLVSLLHRLTGTSDLMETVIKIPVDVGLFLLSYRIQKKWVFGGQDRREKDS